MSKEDCIFCKIIKKEIPSRIVYEDDRVLAIEDINPVAPVHVLLLPKEHIASLNEASENSADLLGYIQLIAARLAKDLKIADHGYRLVNNCGEWGGQTVLHIHYHLLGGKEMGWPPF